MEYELRQDKKNNEFQLKVDELKGECTYVIKGTTMYFMHTGVPKSLEGQGYGSKLVKFALEQAKEQGYKIIPVNPGHNEIAGMKSFPSLSDIPQTIDVVDVFRRSKYVLPIAESAVTVGAKALWLQDGVINKDGATLAEKAGLLVVMNDCMLRRHRQM